MYQRCVSIINVQQSRWWLAAFPVAGWYSFQAIDGAHTAACPDGAHLLAMDCLGGHMASEAFQRRNELLAIVQELGAAGLTKRPTSCMLILPKPPKGGEEDAEFDQAYAEAVKRVKAVQPVF